MVVDTFHLFPETMVFLDEMEKHYGFKAEVPLEPDLPPPEPCTLNPEPHRLNTLNHTPYTSHPTPCTTHPGP